MIPIFVSTDGSLDILILEEILEISNKNNNILNMNLDSCVSYSNYNVRDSNNLYVAYWLSQMSASPPLLYRQA